MKPSARLLRRPLEVLILMLDALKMTVLQWSVE